MTKTEGKTQYYEDLLRFTNDTLRINYANRDPATCQAKSDALSSIALCEIAYALNAILVKMK